MIGRLSSRVAIVTGSSAGLGRAIALAYGREGAHVVCADVSPLARLASPDVDSTPTHEAISKLGGRSVFTQCNVTEAKDVEEAVQTAVKEFGRLDIMVNNAGISVESTRQNPLLTHETTLEDFEKTWKVNTKGVFLGCKHAVLQMLKQDVKFGNDAGWIINIASVLSLVGFPGSISYVASKGAVSQMTKTIALEYAGKRIHCNEICPGFTKTALLAPYMTPDGAETLAILGARHPLGGLGSPHDLAGAAIFLASDDANWITGISLPVDGGYVAGR